MLATKSGGHIGIEPQGFGTTEEFTFVKENKASGVETTGEIAIVKENKIHGIRTRQRVGDNRGRDEMPKMVAGGRAGQAK